jgi:polysaccharide export outer membrane protein
MRKSYLRKFFLFAQILFLSIVFFSCTSTKNIKYFRDIPDSGALKTIPTAEYLEPAVQVDDILTIMVETVDPTATTMINMGNVPVSNSATQIASSTGSLGQTVSAGYLVDKEGYIEVPVLGKIKAVGYTTSQLRDIIKNIAVKYYNDPTVIVRYANFKISITGEVLKPGQYISPNEKLSILDAIAMAGDLTIYGKRDNVLLIRENPDGTKTPYRINLNNSNIMSAPYYYLRQNDVIYVQPSNGKAQANDLGAVKWASITSAVLSLLIVIATRIK